MILGITPAFVLCPGPQGFTQAMTFLIWAIPSTQGSGVFLMRTLILWSLFQSLDYDRCINDPYLEVLETMDNKVRPCMS